MKEITNRLILICLIGAGVNFLMPSCLFGDLIELKDGEKIDGKITKETETEMTVKLRNTTGSREFPKSQIKSIKKGDVPEEQLYSSIQDQYRVRLGKIDPKDANAQLELAEWCEKNDLLKMAQTHYKIAAQLDPDIAKKAQKDLLHTEDKAAEKIFSEAEAEFKKEEYINSEKLIFSVISAYPNSEYAAKARGLLAKIWGRERSDRLLGERDNLPEIFLPQQAGVSPLSQIRLNAEELKEKYFMKYLNKAKDLEERAREVNEDRSRGYYIIAIDCYQMVLFSDKAELKNTAYSKMQPLLKKFFEGDLPVPYDSPRYLLIGNYINSIEDGGLAEKIIGGYLKMGKDLYEKAKEAKEPEKTEDITIAHFCFSIAENSSKIENIKQEARNYIVKSQGLLAPLKK